MNEPPSKEFYVYITASKPGGVIYVGMISDLARRAWQHRQRVTPGFATKYWVGRLVYYERHDCAATAAKRERLMKRWRRAWKIELIEQQNPTWADLFPRVLREAGYEW